MKRGIIFITGGLLASVALYSCGDAEKTAELEKQLEEAKQRTTFVSDSLSLECQAKLDELTAKIDELTAPKPAAEKPAEKAPIKPAATNTGKKSTTDAPANTGKKSATDAPANTGKKGGTNP